MFCILAKGEYYGYISTVPDSDNAQFLFLMMVVISLISLVISIIAWWAIFSKAGYSGALSLLFFIPIAGLIMFLVFAFGKWPILRRARDAPSATRSLPVSVGATNASGPQYLPYQQGQQYSSSPQYPSNPQYPQY